MPDLKMQKRHREGVMRLRAESLNEDDRSVETIMSTEEPVDFGFFREMLLMSGADYPDQVPFQDAHSRGSIRDTIGHVREIRIEDNQMVGRAFFATTELGELAIQMVRDGHLTDVSIGYTPLKFETLDAGQTKKFGKREISGPVDVVTSWRLSELSLVPVGADKNAKVRGEIIMPDKDEKKAAGAAAVAEPQGETPAPQERAAPVTPAAAPEPAAKHPAPEPVDLQAERAAAEKRGREVERERSRAIAEICTIGHIPSARANEYISGDKTAEEVRAEVAAEVAKQRAHTPHMSVSRDEGDTTRRALTDGALLSRGVLKPYSKAHDGETGYACEEAAQFRGLTTIKSVMRKFARRCAPGFDLERYEDRNGWDFFRALNYHCRSLGMGTGNFPKLLVDATNKALLTGYELAGGVWRDITRRAVLNDLRTKHIAHLASIPAMQEIGEKGEIPLVELTESKETYKPGTWAHMLSMSDEIFINDDLGAFTDLPRAAGDAAMATIDKTVLALLLMNSGKGPTMADNVALFHEASHGNLAGSSDDGPIAEATLNAAILALSTQTDENGEIMEIEPAILLVPSAIKATAKKWMDNGSLPGGTNEERNPHQGLARVVSSGRLNNGFSLFRKGDKEATTYAGDAEGWRLFGDPNRFPVLEIGFLDGRDTPFIEAEDEFDVLGTKLRSYIRFGVGAVSHRGAYMNDGNAS